MCAPHGFLSLRFLEPRSRFDHFAHAFPSTKLGTGVVMRWPVVIMRYFLEDGKNFCTKVSFVKDELLKKHVDEQLFWRFLWWIVIRMNNYPKSD